MSLRKFSTLLFLVLLIPALMLGQTIRGEGHTTGNGGGASLNTNTFSGTQNAPIFNGTGPTPFEVNGAAATCGNLLSDCSSLQTLSGSETPTNKNFITNNSGNTLVLAGVQGQLAPITGTGAAAAIYTYNIPQGIPGPGRCIEAFVQFRHTTGSTSTTFNWSFVPHGNALASTGTAIVSTGTTIANDSLLLCNAPGVQNSQFLMQQPTSFGNAWVAGGLTTASVNMNATGGSDLTFTFNVANTDAVTPGAFVVLALQ